MYIILKKSDNSILHMSNSFPGVERKPEEIYPPFDPETMEFGRAPEQRIPIHFAIQDGVVVDLAPPPPAPKVTLAEHKARVLAKFSQTSMAMRQRLIPDYQLMNAGMGIYDAARTLAYQTTVQAFRDEYHRLEIMVGKAKSLKDLDAIEPFFPKALVEPTPPRKATPPPAAKTTRKTK